MTLTRRDKVVTVILVVLILVLLYMLQCHWRNRFGSHGEAKPVGEVEYKYHQVQRKYSDRMLWEDVESKTPVYPYDWVMTKDKSDARITLKNGMKVEMDPESMVEIDENRDGVGLTLRDGTIRADTRDSKSGTITASDGTRIDLTKGNAQISTDGKNLSIDVKEGKATVKNRDKESKLGPGESGSVDRTGIRKEKTSIVLKSPPQDMIVEDPSRPVNFAFDAGAGARDCAIALSSGGRKRTIRVESSQHSEKLGDGTYQWRVSCTLKGQKVSSQAGAFRVRPEGYKSQVAVSSPNGADKNQNVAAVTQPDKQGNPPKDGSTQAVNPATTANPENQKLAARAPGQVTMEPDEIKTAVRISWNTAGKDWSYRVRVADSRDFSDPLITRNVTGKGQTTVSLKPGEYYYRVDMRSSANGKAIASTAPQKITVVRKKLPAPPRVKSVQAD